MKKTIGMALAMALLFPPGQASAEILRNLKVGGMFDFQANSGRNITDFSTRPNDTGAAANQDRTGDTLTRVLVDLNWDLLDDVHSTISLRKNDRAWATTGNAGQGAGGTQGVGSQGGACSNAACTTTTGPTGVLGSVYVQRANVKIDKMMGHFDVTVGRQYYGTPGDLIWYAGPKDVHGLDVTSFDAFRVDTMNDWMSMTAVAARMGENGFAAAPAVGGATNDRDIRGLEIWWKGLPLKVNTFAWNRIIHADGGIGADDTTATADSGGKSDNLYVYGIKLRGEAGGGWVNVDVAANAGDCRGDVLGSPCSAAVSAVGYTNTARYTGTAALLDAGFNADVPNLGGFTPWVNFGWGTGRANSADNKNADFQSIGSDYRPGIINRRFNTVGAGTKLGSGMLGGTALNNGQADISTNGLGNRVVWGFGTNFTPAAWDQLTLGLSYWDFRFQRNLANPQGTANAHTTANGNKHIGSEAGVTATWAHSENVMLSAGAGWFMPGGFVKETITSSLNTAGTPGQQINVATTAFADLSVRF